MLEDENNVLTIQEVAKILNVSTQTLRRWDKTELLTAFRASKTQPRRYHKKDVIAFLEAKPQKK